MKKTIHPTTIFIYSLEKMPHVGRISARKIIKYFPTYKDICTVPLEQIRTRLKGMRHVDELLKKIKDQRFMQSYLTECEQELLSLASKEIQFIHPIDKNWSSILEHVEGSVRPNLLYGFGNLDLLSKTTVGFIAKPPIASSSHEISQQLGNFLLNQGITLVTGINNGFDVVMQKTSLLQENPKGTIQVAHCGFGKIETQFRPFVVQNYRNKGLTITSFPMDHGLFEHDRKESLFLLCALSRAVVFVEPQVDSFEWRAMLWSTAKNIPTFAIADATTPLPLSVHPIKENIDFEWVLTSLKYA